MRKMAIVAALVAILALAPARLALGAATETQISAAAAGYFPPGASFSGIPLQGSTFGIGVVVYPDGTATGDLEIVLAGTSQLGQPQYLTLVAKAETGVANPDGSVSFSGTGMLDMGDGALPVTVPFSATITPTGLQLTIGTTVLPTQLLSAGSIFIG
jgi:hypothetical protein